MVSAFWLRWGDALKEAGFTPNQLSTAISSDAAIEKLICLIRELGHFPIHGELRIKAKEDSTFPSHGVFDKFGGKKKIAAAVVNYCRTHEGFDDVVELCTAHVGENGPVSAEATEAAQGNSDGFVYLMKSGRFYKIGRTDAVGRRHKEI